LSISGFADIPNGKGPFPVIIMLHGRSDAENFSIFEQDTGYAEMYAQEGYIVLHPNLRNYRPSDQGDNHLLIGMTVDTLNLIALVKAQAGQEGILKKANADRLGLWAFSMGGAVALKVLTISPNIKSAFLYSPMSGDDHLNARFLAKAGEIEAQQDLTLPSVVFNVSSAQNYFKDITSAVDIHHGLDDTTIPPEQAEKTCDDLRKLGKTINCYFYEDMPHVFAGNGGVKLKLRMVNFFNTHLKATRGTPAP
jgi:dienelactone hydrolase